LSSSLLQRRQEPNACACARTFLASKNCVEPPKAPCTFCCPGYETAVVLDACSGCRWPQSPEELENTSEAWRPYGVLQGYICSD
jgi:hypothetical protein